MEVTKELRDAIEAYKSGNDEAFTTIYNESKAYIRTCISNAISDYDSKEDMIADIMQETYFEISKCIEKLENTDSFLSWAATIAKRRSYEMIKKSNKYVLLPEEANFDGLADDNNKIPEQIVQDAEKQRIVREAIDTELSEKEKACVVGFYYNDMKKSEIGEELGIPENTVKTNLTRAKKKLAKVINITLVVAAAAAITVLILNNSLWKKVEPKKEPLNNEKETTAPTTGTGEETTSPTTGGDEEALQKEGVNYDISLENLYSNEGVVRYEVEKGYNRHGIASYCIYKYDVNDNLLGTESYDANGILEGGTAIRYDKYNNCVLKIYCNYDDRVYGTVYGERYTYVYDEHNNVVKGIYPYTDGSTKTVDYTLTYYPNGELKSRRYNDEWSDTIYEVIYDEQGRVFEDRQIYPGDEAGEADTYYYDRYTYNQAGEILRVESYNRDDAIGDKLATEEVLNGYITYEYDEEGRLVKKQNYEISEETGKATPTDYEKYVYNQSGQSNYIVYKYIDGKEETVSHVYKQDQYDTSISRLGTYFLYGRKDYVLSVNTFKPGEIETITNRGILQKVSRCVYQQNYNGDEFMAGFAVLNYDDYDEAGKLVRIDNYSVEGTLINYVKFERVEDIPGNVVKLTYVVYSPEGRRLYEMDSIDISECDSQGRVTKTTRADGLSTVEYKYDDQGRVIEEIVRYKDTEDTEVVAYEYKNDIKKTYINGILCYTEEFDEAGRVIKNVGHMEKYGVDNFVLTFEYDEAGRVIKEDRNGPSSVYHKKYTYRVSEK